MIKRFYLIVIALTFAFMASAQRGTYTSWEQREANVKQMFYSLEMLEDNDQITRVADTIMREMMEIVKDVEFNFGTEFKNLPNVGCVVSDDQNLCMYTWNVPLRDANNTSQFYALCYSKVYDVVYAFSQGNPRVPAEKGTIAQTDWYGAMYYRIIPVKVKESTGYLLLGYAPIDNNRQYKVIDVMMCNKRGVKFGSNLFVKENGKKFSRIVFEYGRSVQMSLEYDSKKKKILYDHLTQMSVDENGKPIMGPDMSVDAFVLKGGLWVYMKDLNVKNPREDK